MSANIKYFRPLVKQFLWSIIWLIYGYIWLIFPPYRVYNIYPPSYIHYIFSQFWYRIYTKFVFDFIYVIGQTSFMSIYFMCEATFMIVISLFERTLRWTHIHFFLSFLLLLLLFRMNTSTSYTTHSIWHLLLRGSVFVLYTVTIWGFSIFISLKLFRVASTN